MISLLISFAVEFCGTGTVPPEIKKPVEQTGFKN